MGNNRAKAVVETDFVGGNGLYVELVRTMDSRLVFASYEDEGQKVSIDNRSYLFRKRLLVPPEEDDLIRRVRFAQKIGEDASVQSLLQQMDSLISRCLDLDPEYRFLLGCFVLATWIVDRLPIAPIVAIVGLSQSGKTTALNVLRLLCRRSILVSDISSLAFYRMCDRLMPTVLIDNTATMGLERKLIHLLRSGTTPGITGSPLSQSYSTYGSKVVTWTELPEDGALNSRCIIIPMQETSRTDLLRFNDPEIVAAADSLQGRLLMYRFQKYSSLPLTQIPGGKNLRSRNRDLYEALAFPIAEDPEACARLLECMGQQNDLHTESLPPDHAAVLETLFQLIHLQPEQGTLAFSYLTEMVNLNLERAGERFRLTAKGVGRALTRLGLFAARNRISSGTVGSLDRAARKRIHELVSRYGIDGLANYLPSERPWERCEFCKVQDPQNAETATTDESTSKWSTEATDRNTFDVVQPPAQPEKDPAPSPVQPNLAEEQPFLRK